MSYVRSEEGPWLPLVLLTADSSSWISEKRGRCKYGEVLLEKHGERYPVKLETYLQQKVLNCLLEKLSGISHAHYCLVR